MNRGKDLQEDETIFAYWDFPRCFQELNKMIKPHGIKITDRVAVKVVKIGKKG